MEEEVVIIYGLVTVTTAAVTKWAHTHDWPGWKLGLIAAAAAIVGAAGMAALCVLKWRSVIQFGMIALFAGIWPMVGEWRKSSNERTARRIRHATANTRRPRRFE